MTKLESAEVLIKQKGDCERPITISCKNCCLKKCKYNYDCRKCNNKQEVVVLAIAYKQEHENEKDSDIK